MKTINTDDIYKSTQNLLRTLVVLTQGLDPLPDAMLTMKLTYYDSVTPTDYEPAGFLSTPLVELKLPLGSASFSSGKVDTSFHSIQLGVKAVVRHGAHQQEDVQLNQQADQTHQEVNQQPAQIPAASPVGPPPSARVSPTSVLSQPAPESSSLLSGQHHAQPPSAKSTPVLQPSQTQSSVSLLSGQSRSQRLSSVMSRNPSNPQTSQVSPAASLLSGHSQSHRQPTSVKSTPGLQPSQAPSSVSLLSGQSEAFNSIHCLCSNSHPDPVMLQCQHCGYWQHAACYRIVSEDRLPVRHCCVECSVSIGVVCTDPKLVKMSVNPAITQTCLFRRVLSLLNQEAVVTLQLVMSRLGVAQDTVDNLLQKLSMEGCLVEEGGQWVVQREQFETTVLPKYLGRKRPVRVQAKINGGGGERSALAEGDEVKKCSTVAKPYQIAVTGVKRGMDLDNE